MFHSASARRFVLCLIPIFLVMGLGYLVSSSTTDREKSSKANVDPARLVTNINHDRSFVEDEKSPNLGHEDGNESIPQDPGIEVLTGSQVDEGTRPQLGGSNSMLMDVFAQIDHDEKDQKDIANSQSYLHRVCAGDGSEFPKIKLYLENDADLESRDKEGNTPLLSLCRSISGDAHHLPAIELLVESGANVNARNNNGDSPLMNLCRNQEWWDLAGDHLSAVEFLIENGANVDARNNDGSSALLILCASRYLPESYSSVMLKFFEKGVDPNSTDKDGDSPLHCSMHVYGGGSIDLWKFKFFVENGTDINGKNNHGITPLMMLSSHRFSVSEDLECLVENGAELEVRCNAGRTALFYSCASYSNFERSHFDWLLEKGADAFARDADGESLYHYAVRGRGSVEKLFQLGVPLDLGNNAGVTPLMLACQQAGTGSAKYLIEHGASVHKRDQQGRTPLMYAAQNPWGPDSIDFLLTHEAELEATDNDGRTALMHAAEFMPENINLDRSWWGARFTPVSPDILLQRLLDKGAAPNTRDNAGRLTYDVAWGNVTFPESWTLRNLDKVSDRQY